MNAKHALTKNARLIGFAAAALVFAAGAYAATSQVAVNQKGSRYSTESVTINPGEAINFINDDETVHNVSVKDEAGDYVAALVEKPGEEKTVTFDKPGEYSVLCMIHPKMRMTVSVK